MGRARARVNFARGRDGRMANICSDKHSCLRPRFSIIPNSVQVESVALSGQVGAGKSRALHHVVAPRRHNSRTFCPRLRCLGGCKCSSAFTLCSLLSLSFCDLPKCLQICMTKSIRCLFKMHSYLSSCVLIYHRMTRASKTGTFILLPQRHF